jgi:hypothetical protein
MGHVGCRRGSGPHGCRSARPANTRGHSTAGTDRLHSFDLWSEATTDGTTWKRETLEHAAFNLKSHEARLTPVAMPTNGKPRVVLRCALIDASDLAYWRDRAVMLMGKNPSRAYKMYVVE